MLVLIGQTCPMMGYNRTSHLELHETLSLIRKRRGISQKEAARQMRVQPKTMSRWENGDTRPTFEDVVRLVGVYSDSPEEMTWNLNLLYDCIDDINEEIDGHEISVSRHHVMQAA